MRLDPRRSRLAKALATLITALVLGAATPAAAGSRLEEAANRGWLGLAAVTCSTVYAPLKVFIGGSGLIVAGSAWVFTGSAREPALTIFERTLGGDWLITPDHLSGDRDFSVLGRSHARRVARR
jgi:hypothetical protein